MDEGRQMDGAGNRDDVTRRIIGQVESLPPMPATAMRLRAAASDPNVGFARLVPLIEKDPGLCADLLHFANSAAYGVGHPVETVGEAVLYFGMDNLVEFILVSYSNRLVRESFGQLRHLEDYFVHSEQVSLACCLLAKEARLPRHDQEVCKVTGLLHNIGKLVLLLATRQWGGALLGAPWDERQVMVTLEEQRFGLSHCEVGARLCEKWQFPEKLLAGIRHHHRPVQDGRVIPLAAYVYLGELLVIDNLPMSIIMHDLSAEHLADLNLTEEKLVDARKAFASMRDSRLASVS
jgi:HD-like signal output (HDOD) protein